jgi:hypothetical protein
LLYYYQVSNKKPPQVAASGGRAANRHITNTGDNSMTIIFDATNQPTRAYLDILSEVPDGGYIYSHGRFLRKTGWRSAVAVDMRHLDHEPGSGADLLAFLEGLNEEPFIHSHPGNGWGL